MDIQRPPVKRLILIGLFLSFLLVRPEISFADSTIEKAGGKLIRGVANVSTGWVEVFHGVWEVFMKEGPITGLFYGPIRGTGMALIRTGSGVYETATFLFPVPAKYESTIQPEFVWEGWSGFGGLEAFMVSQNTPGP